MDWITTSGRTLDEAKSHALDQLGIVADEAEFDVVNDVEKGLFGRIKTEAKIRARVRPKQPAAKDDRRRRGNGSRGRGNGSGRGRQGNGGRDGGAKKSGRSRGGKQGGGQQGSAKQGSAKQGSAKQGSAKQSSAKQADGQKRGGKQADGQKQQASGSRRQGDRTAKNQRSKGSGTDTPTPETGADDASSVPSRQAGENRSTTTAKKDIVEHEFSREEQERAAVGFLEGVLDVFGMEGAVTLADEVAEDDAIELAVTGNELGLLVGQKGVTLNALQELTRTVVQRQADGAKTERLRVDVAGYRVRRTAALQDFARRIAADVVETDSEKVLEPMGPADRKVVHDALTDFAGVETGSEGEEPRRRVVIRPV